jgi:ribosomal protein L17
MIDMASVYAERFKSNPRMLQAAVMGQSPDPKLDPYTALNALRLVKEANMMAMAGKAQQPTSQPSILADALTPPTPPQGLAGMPMGAPAGQMPPRPMPQGQPMPQPPVQQASGGLAGMPVHDHDYAGGGIVAFARGDLVESEYQQETPDEGYSDSFGRPIDNEGTADPTVLATAQQRLKEYMDYAPQEMSAKDQEAFLDRYMARVEKAGGPNIYAPALEKLKARDEARGKDRSHGEGLALLAAAGKILKGHNLATGASEALPAFAQQMGEVHRADIQEQRSIEQMNFALADAQRKERMGDARGAQAALAEARKFQQDANRAQGDKLRYGADIAARTVQYSKAPNKGAGAGGPKVAEQLAAAEIEVEKNPTPENKAIVNALRRTVSQTKTSFSTGEIGPERAAVTRLPVQEKIDAAVSNGIAKFKLLDGGYRRAQRAGDTAEANRLLNEERARIRKDFESSEVGAGGARQFLPVASPGTAANPIKLP